MDSSDSMIYIIAVVLGVGIFFKFKDYILGSQVTKLKQKDEDLKKAADGTQEAINQIKEQEAKQADQQKDLTTQQKEDFWKKN